MERGYYVDTVGRYEGAIKEYIRNQLQEAGEWWNLSASTVKGYVRRFKDVHHD